MISDAGFSFAAAEGGTLHVPVWQLRGGDGPRVHLQAGVHGDEIPPMLVLHRLLPRLIAAHDTGRLRGTVTVVPQCNPIARRQHRRGRLSGRYDEPTGYNFNRDVSKSVARPTPGIAAWQAGLASLVADADIVLDLHTDDEALPYLYVPKPMWPATRDLAASLAAAVVIVWDDDGGDAFEEYAARTATLAATIELRGQADVSDALADVDADAIHRFLCGRGVIDEATAAADWSGTVVALDAVERIAAPESGILVFERPLGAHLAAGERFARIVPRPGAPHAEDVPLVAPQAGLFFARHRDRMPAAGEVVAKIAAAAPSADRRTGPLDP